MLSFLKGRKALAMLAALAAAGCTTSPPMGDPAMLTPTTPAKRLLQYLPPPTEPIIVAVYNIPDKTGQHKPNDEFSEYSRAVTQGATELLIEALQDAGQGRWFVVLEREGLDNLLRERQLIRVTREQYLGNDGQPLPPPPPLLYAPILIEGAVVSYESNTRTGGVGARFLGIGGSAIWEHDRVTVSVRASSTQTGRMIRSVSATKDIYSAGTQGGAFRFVDVDKLLEIEAGTSRNEPPQLAVRRALEKAVHSLVIEGALAGAWRFAEPNAARPIIEDYLQERDGAVVPSLVEVAAPGTLRPAEERTDLDEQSPAQILAEELRERMRQRGEEGARTRNDEPDIYDQPRQRREDAPPPQQQPQQQPRG